MIGDTSFTIKPRRGEYVLLDRSCGSLAKHTLFQTPTKLGKGILVTPTVDGNLLLGPTATDIEDKTCKKTSSEGLNTVLGQANRYVNGIDTRQTITSIEVGKYIASLPLAYKIAHHFGLTIEEVFDFSDLED